MERSTRYLGYHTLNKVHALESANVSASPSAHKVAPSLDPSKPSSSSTCHPPLAASCHAMPPHLMSISDVRLLLHLAARVAPIVVAHLAAPPPRPAPDRPPAPIACLHPSHSSGSCTFRFALYRLQLLLCVTQCAAAYTPLNYFTELREAIAGRNQDRQKNQLPENNNQKREGVERIHGAAIPNFGSLRAVHDSLGSARREVAICRVRCPGDVTAARQVTDG